MKAPHLIGALLSLLLLSACTGKSLDIAVEPVSDELSETRELGWLTRASINTWLRFNAWRGAQSGYVALIALDGKPNYATTAGWADIAAERPMEIDTRMRFASMTKPVTAVAAMILVERGQLQLEDQVAKYLPEFSEIKIASSQTALPSGGFSTLEAYTNLRIEHLLMFASGIGPGRTGMDSDLWRYWNENGPRSHSQGSMRERIGKLAELPLFEEPGKQWRYGWSADVLAAVVEVVSGVSFDAFLDTEIFDPLGMSNTHFRYTDQNLSELATVYTQDAEGDLIVIEPSSDTDYPEGGSGLVSTAEDYMRFALMLFNKGEYRGARILQRETVDEMTTPKIQEGVLAAEGMEGIGWGLGMSVVTNADASLLGDDNGDFGWSGYFGTTFWVSPSTGVVGIVLSQNEPGPYSDLPIPVYAVQSIVQAGLR